MGTTSRQGLADAASTIGIIACGITLAVSGRAISSTARSSSVEVWLGLGASAVGLLLAGWWVLAMSLAVAAALLHASGRSRAAAWAGAAAPAFMRRLALAALGASLVAGPAAHAADLPIDPVWQATSSVPSSPAVPTPVQQGAEEAAAQPQGAEEAAAQPQAPPATHLERSDPTGGAWIPADEPATPGPLARPELRKIAAPSTIEVRPGDSLWAIAARHLGPGADATDVAEAWPRWFEANRSVIGDDPDSIRPGQLLAPPPIQ